MTVTDAKRDSRGSYALVTAAYNEEAHLEDTIVSVCRQTVTPKKWIVVSDGSTDRTDDIVRRCARRWGFIELHRITEWHSRNFSAQVDAINSGIARLKETDCDFVGNLDADITLPSNYFEKLLERFSRDPKLGLAGGVIYEEENGVFRSRRSNSISSVAHAVQLFRRECLINVLGGYQAFPGGGTDWHAQVVLRMKGWDVIAFPDLHVFHHRRTGGAFGFARYCFQGGIEDYYMGTHPLFELFRVARRFRERPYVVAALVRLAAFLWAHIHREKRQVPEEFIRFLRKEQMHRLRGFLQWPSALQQDQRGRDERPMTPAQPVSRNCDSGDRPCGVGEDCICR